MGKLKESSILLFSDERYNKLIEIFTDKEHGETIQLKNIFLLAASIGFKNSKRIKRDKKGKEIRASYLSPSEEELLLNLVLNDAEVNGDIEKLNDIAGTGQIKKIIYEYINGGLQLILDKAFFDNWDGHNFNEKYKHYHFDLSRYVLAEIESIPF